MSSEKILPVYPGTSTGIAETRNHRMKLTLMERIFFLCWMEASGTPAAGILKLAGFSAVLGSVVSSCEKPIHKAIPYLIKPEEITRRFGILCLFIFRREEFCSILVKSRDDVPLK
jgi:molybdopterin-containing oxidoreductase family iron-sulfur binding subunit